MSKDLSKWEKLQAMALGGVIFFGLLLIACLLKACLQAVEVVQ